MCHCAVAISYGMEITENKLKTILKGQRKEFQSFVDGSIKKQREEFQTFIGALAEDFIAQVKLLAESVSDLQRQIVVIRDMVARNTEDIEVIKTDIEMMKNMLRKKVDAEEFASLEKRVLILERNR